tara:strand:+ start:13085 stop:14140 length:1056 start_codon:yes stop_codon:yes gene_type:complete
MDADNPFFIKLKKLIKKTRTHFYKPIQIAEILYKSRKKTEVDFDDLESFRNSSKQWRDSITKKLVGSVSTSSQKFQDNLFDQNAMPIEVLKELDILNKNNNGIIEEYIYLQFSIKMSQISSALEYIKDIEPKDFDLKHFLNLFWNEPGLKRSIDKIYEIVVYSLFVTLVKELSIKVKVTIENRDSEILNDFSDFTKKVIGFDETLEDISFPANIHRVGVTNAADRGLDMWGNFGLAIQVKHLSLTEELAHDVIESIKADRIVIVCKSSEKNVILSLLTQLGWKARIQSIITENDLIDWYSKITENKSYSALSKELLDTMLNGIYEEFPSTNNELEKLVQSRDYILDNAKHL